LAKLLTFRTGLTSYVIRTGLYILLVRWSTSYRTC